MDVVEMILFVLLIVCAASACCTRNLLASLIILMAYSVIMSIIWALLAAPDLAITEAAVGAGISSILLFITLKKIRDIRKEAEHEKEQP